MAAQQPASLRTAAGFFAIWPAAAIALSIGAAIHSLARIRCISLGLALHGRLVEAFIHIGQITFKEGIQSITALAGCIGINLVAAGVAAIRGLRGAIGGFGFMAAVIASLAWAEITARA